MLTALIVTGCILGYLQIGYRLGKKSRQVWDKKESKGAVPFLLFPVSALDGSVGVSSEDIQIVNDCSEETYYVVLSLAWPFKIIWTVLVATIIGMYYGAKYAIYTPFKYVMIKQDVVVGAVTGAVQKRLAACRERREAVKALPPPAAEPAGEEPPTFGEYRLADTQVKELRAKLETAEARKAELGSKLGPDAEKILDQPLRL